MLVVVVWMRRRLAGTGHVRRGDVHGPIERLPVLHHMLRILFRSHKTTVDARSGLCHTATTTVIDAFAPHPDDENGTRSSDKEKGIKNCCISIYRHIDLPSLSLVLPALQTLHAIVQAVHADSPTDVHHRVARGIEVTRGSF